MTDGYQTDNHLTDDYLDRLIEGHLDDGLTESERSELAGLLRDSEGARIRFWRLAEVHGLARDAARMAWPDDASATEPRQARRAAGFGAPAARFARLRPAGLVAAGLALGVLMTGLAWAISRPAGEPVRVLLAENFESTAAPAATGVPTTADGWSGDFTEIVAAQAGVAPADGARMLRFLKADYEGKPNPGGYIAEVYRLIDVRGRRGELAGGDAVAQVSVRFNAAAAPADEKYHASLSLFALDAAALTDGTLRNGGVSLADRAQAVTRRSNQVLDHDPATWQNIATDLRLPADTDYLLLRIAMAHGAPTRDAAGHETFAAHYADDVRLVLTRRPPLP
jgi:hypothetical protein